MTFTGIVDEVLERLNLTSATATARIGRSVNERYRRIASKIGLQTIARGTVTASTVIGNRDVTFGPGPVGVEKISVVTNPAYPNQRPLDEVLWEELRLRVVPSNDTPQTYAIKKMGSNSVTITIDSTPLTVYTLTGDGLLNLSTLSGVQVPAFAENFHDILILHAMAIELDKLEKPALAKEKLREADERTGELQLFIATSALMRIVQGKNSTTYISNPFVAG